MAGYLTFDGQIIGGDTKEELAAAVLAALQATTEKY